MRLRFVLPCFLMAAVSAFGQVPSASDACLRSFAGALQPQARLTADFRMQKHVPGVSRPLPGKGRVVSDPSEGLIWETTFPLQHVRVFGKNAMQPLMKGGTARTGPSGRQLHERIGLSVAQRTRHATEPFILRFLLTKG